LKEAADGNGRQRERLLGFLAMITNHMRGKMLMWTSSNMDLARLLKKRIFSGGKLF
jgi:hypothetical protein